MNYSSRNKSIKTKLLNVLLPVSLLGLISCEPIVTEFRETEAAILYESKEFLPVADTLTDGVTVMTWNIRFGAARIPWFGDSCGDRVILTEEEVESGLEGLAGKINEVDPDILILQEVDVDAKRSLYVDQVQWLLDHTDLNYGAYASIWQAQYIPSDGLVGWIWAMPSSAAGPLLRRSAYSSPCVAIRTP